MPTHLISLCLLVFVTATAVSCRHADRVEITLSRPRHSVEKAPRLDVPLIDSLPAIQKYRWTLPPGWMEIPATQFRLINFAFGPAGEGECYVSVSRGSELENVNRWRQQMAQPPLGQDELAALPRKTVFGHPAAFVDLTGTYNGAGGVTPAPDTRMLGVILADVDTIFTVKLTGPADLVAAHAEHFDTFVTSLRLTPTYNP